MKVSEVDYYDMIFVYAFTQEDIKICRPEQGNVNKIVNGIERKVPKDMLGLYNDEKGHERLLSGVENVLKEVKDPGYIQEKLEEILHWDNLTSDTKKEELLEKEDSPVEFITACLLVGIFQGAPKKKDGSPKGIVLSDYLVKYKFPSVKKEFHGRQHELYDIHQILQEKDHLFLEGIGGIGKSELARQYGKSHKKEYENILFIRYSENLRKTMIQLEFVDDKPNMTDEELFRSHYRFLKQLSSETLVILDNFDTVPEQEQLFYEFLNLPFQLLVTTRSHIEDVNVYPINEIESTSELLQLFYEYAPKSSKKEAAVKEIIEEVYRHTLAVEMAAKTLAASDMEPENLLTALREEGLFLSNPNKIKVVKDDEMKRERLYRHIQTLFKLQKLSEEKRYILMHMVLVSERGIAKRLFHEWLQTDDFNTTNDLIDYGWIQQDSENNQISLHPFLCEVLKDFTKPSIQKCEQFLFSIFCVCAAYGTDMDYYQDVLNTIETIFKNIEVDNTLLAFALFDKIIPYFGKYQKFDKMEWALDKMKETIPMDGNHKTEKANYELYKGIIEMGKNDYQKATEYFFQGVTTLAPIHKGHATLATNLFCNLGNCFLRSGNNRMLQICIIYLKHFQKYTSLYTHDSVVQECLIAQFHWVNGEDEKAIETLHQTLEKTKDFPDFHTTSHDIYSLLGGITLKKDPQKALEYLQKAEYELSQHMNREEAKEDFSSLNILMEIAKGVKDGMVLIEDNEYIL